MNYDMVKRLILKDWYLQRVPIALSIIGGLISLAIVAKGGQAGFTLGIILLVTALVTIGAMLAMNLTVVERKEQTLAFVMTLPVSYREYTAAKILGILLIFLVPWLAFMAGSLAVIEFAPEIRGLVPFIVIMGFEILANTCMIAATGLISESQGWTITALMIGNLALNVIGYAVAHIPSIGHGMFGPVLHWSATASGLLAAEIGTIGLILGGTFFFPIAEEGFSMILG